VYVAHQQQQRCASKPLSCSFEVALKDDYGLPVRTTTKSKQPTLATTATNRHVVAFKPAVTVHPIPSRNNYSNRIRSQLWTPYEELQENAARNSIEFAAENFDWTNVAEEKDMIFWHGEHVHPIHFDMIVEQEESMAL
jgi:hypothetical protein